MRATILTILLLPGLALAGAQAVAEDEKTADAPPAEKAAAKAEADKEFKPPPGWKMKKRGQYTVYCRKQTPQGTRVPVETCHDEAGIRAMLAAQEDDKQRVDQMRRICATPGACGSN
jgi:hypothetical protein